jgi:rRNA maturation endonuclease Nob1
MNTCEHCHNEYNEELVNIPTPIPDGMCAYCGTQLTEKEIADLIKEFQINIIN